MKYFIPLINVIIGLILGNAARIFFDTGNTLMGILMLIILVLIVAIEIIEINERWKLEKEIIDLKY